ncbi:hypothetical protein CWE09_09340 [Aliidiomarina minuta]|uniref:DUF4097 domain-containing protein n=1 Tax=Aliidiomarina minuta TaxID=880057 RepID=A0A432W9P6_9GAMM|nr:DUF4097 family beta strand repeat-containing protein [Aliidiomarina minuta]RUO26873.1 hypothetical protein CWE09_09340 [Aliidiomarina minuta]
MKNYRLFMLAAMLTALPAAALADEDCNLESIERITLDVADVRAFKVSVGPDKIQLQGREQDNGELRIRKCASSNDRLNALQANQVKQGDTLTLELDHGGQANYRSSFFGFMRTENYGYFEISGTVPSHWALDIAVGSGDADITEIASVNIVIGSGDASIKNVAGEVTATLGSGDLEIKRVGSLSVSSIGSGDLEADYISGTADIGSIGSGDAELDNIGGDVTVGNIGSGTLDIERVAGNVSVGTLGSGDIRASHIEGDFTLRSKGSGSIDINNIRGSVQVPNR